MLHSCLASFSTCNSTVGLGIPFTSILQCIPSFPDPKYSSFLDIFLSGWNTSSSNSLRVDEWEVNLVQLWIYDKWLHPLLTLDSGWDEYRILGWQLFSQFWKNCSMLLSFLVQILKNPRSFWLQAFLYDLLETCFLGGGSSGNFLNILLSPVFWNSTFCSSIFIHISKTWLNPFLLKKLSFTNLETISSGIFLLALLLFFYVFFPSFFIFLQLLLFVCWTFLTHSLLFAPLSLCS